MNMMDAEDCRVLKYVDMDKPLMAGVDFGNMCSMSVAQNCKEGTRDCIRVIKFLHTLPPDYVPELGKKFRRYFKPLGSRILKLYYDRAGNAYKSVGEDQVSKLKRAIEYDGSERTGWTVQLMSINQGNIPQPEEYAFMQELFSETNPRLPVVRIDASAAKYLKLSLENARTKVKSGIVFKDKSTERLPVDLLPTRSTNPSDSFKYLTMTKQLRQIAKGRAPVSSASSDPQCR